ncbi:fimbria/pilus outer membrane usher protein [Enhydrobacter sp.]|uniref:fimbria/pilus outer membrane usher protein n=1 Tax=Enhydrobacter sp. TaxID=1894999 RepID=UPI00260AADA5|nr:fimbria/pilus outer membrane usher protein [Enhydrobacter sp.]WIM09050.1 MAG: Sigma-fimbriae usher protein [Enhydrobacter sp.]
MAGDGGAILRAALVAAIVVLSAVMARPRPALADETLLLEVVVNGYPTGKIGEFVQRDGALYARRDALRELGFRVPAATAETPDKLVKLADLPDFAARLDAPTQTLHVTAGPKRLLPELLEVAGTTPGSGGTVESGIGATLNYDVTASSTNPLGLGPGTPGVGSGLFDFRAFSPWGVLSNGLLAYVGGNPAGLSGYSAIRLDSTYVYSDPDDLMRYRAGDFISGGLSWTRPVRLGGGQVTSDFSMRPDLVTFPLPVVSGTVAVPSTVDVLVNGNRVLSREVQPGPFQVPQLPVITGAGTVMMTVTNALGRQVTTELPFYASASLLAPGLQTFSLEGGLVRRNWGLISNDYGAAAGAATWRRGLSDAFTVEAHAEGTDGVFMGGAGLVWNAFDLAAVNLAAAVSGGSGGTGGQVTVGLQRLGQPLNLAASATFASFNFADIAAANGQPAAQLQINASAGLALGKYGSLSVAYNGIERAAAMVQTVSAYGQFFYLQPAQSTHLVSATWSAQVLDNVSLYATAYDDLAGYGGRGVMVGLTVPLGRRSSAGLSASATNQERAAQLQASQTADVIGDWGWRLFGGGSDVNADHEFAELQYKSPWGLALGGVDRLAGQTTFQAEARGAVSWAGGGLFASNRIDDSFAVVDTDGVPGVHVQQENRDAGVTNAAGQVLVPDLRAFELNHLSIDPTDVPVDATVPYTTREVRPQDRSGVVVRFPIKTSHGALVRLKDEAGRPIPLGSIATLQSSRATAPVGYDGEVYLVDLQPRNELVVERRNGQRCRATFAFSPKPGDIPTIGPIPCREPVQ